MSPFPQAPDDVPRRRLADSVCRHLRSIGLPAWIQPAPDRMGHTLDLAGAAVEIDPGEPPGGGVLLEWQPDHALRRRAIDRLRDGDLDHPDIRLGGVAREALVTAIATVLTDAGFDVRPSDDDLRPFTLRIDAGPGED
ncbi:hypothetical protein [Stackebrandtia albiflava]|uniref:hypothetical protein n=1 Tax=Stackebrandtia albiflava TaxID=406432 RepID=UPI0011BD7967|nr:hypothetical protein [Stackebrandtia albiflava]